MTTSAHEKLERWCFPSGKPRPNAADYLKAARFFDEFLAIDKFTWDGLIREKLIRSQALTEMRDRHRKEARNKQGGPHEANHKPVR